MDNFEGNLEVNPGGGTGGFTTQKYIFTIDYTLQSGETLIVKANNVEIGRLTGSNINKALSYSTILSSVVINMNVINSSGETVSFIVNDTQYEGNDTGNTVDVVHTTNWNHYVVTTSKLTSSTTYSYTIKLTHKLNKGQILHVLVNEQELRSFILNSFSQIELTTTQPANTAIVKMYVNDIANNRYNFEVNTMQYSKDDGFEGEVHYGREIIYNVICDETPIDITTSTTTTTTTTTTTPKPSIDTTPKPSIDTTPDAGTTEGSGTIEDTTTTTTTTLAPIEHTYNIIINYSLDENEQLLLDDISESTKRIVEGSGQFEIHKTTTLTEYRININISKKDTGESVKYNCIIINNTDSLKNKELEGNGALYLHISPGNSNVVINSSSFSTTASTVTTTTTIDTGSSPDTGGPTQKFDFYATISYNIISGQLLIAKIGDTVVGQYEGENTSTTDTVSFPVDHAELTITVVLKSTSKQVKFKANGEEVDKYPLGLSPGYQPEDIYIESIEESSGTSTTTTTPDTGTTPSPNIPTLPPKKENYFTNIYTIKPTNKYSNIIVNVNVSQTSKVKSFSRSFNLVKISKISISKSVDSISSTINNGIICTLTLHFYNENREVTSFGKYKHIKWEFIVMPSSLLTLEVDQSDTTICRIKKLGTIWPNYNIVVKATDEITRLSTTVSIPII